MPIDIEALKQLSSEEKLRIIHELWEDLSANPGDIPVSEAVLEEVERRRAEMLANPASAVPWEEVKRRIKERHGF
jgi:putative addiction module component (TIGR02574 family)